MPCRLPHKTHPAVGRWMLLRAFALRIPSGVLALRRKVETQTNFGAIIDVDT